jgi:hypothetical protein
MEARAVCEKKQSRCRGLTNKTAVTFTPLPISIAKRARGLLQLQPNFLRDRYPVLRAKWAGWRKKFAAAGLLRAPPRAEGNKNEYSFIV